MQNKSKAGDNAGNINLKEKLSPLEYISYGMGDVGCCIVWMLSVGMVTYFYTDYMGVSAALVGTILLISRVFDGVSDVVIGAIIDKTKSKHGKCRAWVLWMIIPFGVTLVLMYTVPHTNATITALYIFLSYNLVTTIVYTAVNLPYGALASVMTRDKKQREYLTLVRMSLSPIGIAIASSLSLPMVKFFGDDQRAWIITMTILAFLGMGLLLWTFLGTKERIVIDATPDQEKAPTLVAFKAMVTNKYWWMLFIMCIGYSVYLQINNQVVAYYSEYVLGDALKMSVLNSVHSFAETFAALACFLLIRYMTKSRLVMGGGFIIIIGSIIALLNPLSMPMITVACALRGIGIGMFAALMYTMTIDTIEYGHWRTGIRSEGLLYSANTVGQKLGNGVAAAMVGFMLEAAGYNGSLDVQSVAATDTIMFLFNWMPVICAAIISITCFFYKLDREYDGIMADLLNGKYSPKLDMKKLLASESKYKKSDNQ